MKLKEADKDIIISFVLLIINILIYTQLGKIRWGSPSFALSAVLLPTCLNVLFSILILALFGTSLKKGGRINFKIIGDEIKNGVKSRDFKVVITAMIATGVLCFVGVPYLGFFISGGIFMFAIMFFFVKYVKPIYSLLFTGVTLGLIYLIFIYLFKVPLR